MFFKVNFLSIFLIIFISFTYAQNNLTPESFIIHKVKKGDNLFNLTKKYGVNSEQIEEYNPMLIKKGLKRRMQLRIPVYSELKLKNPVVNKTNEYIVKPKDTKWRIAYEFGISIDELEKLNPSIKNELKYGQTIFLPKKNIEDKKSVELGFYYYKVKPKEGYYRIKLKTGIDKSIIDSLNPQLHSGGLKQGMVLKLPILISDKLNMKDSFLTEKITLIDSIIKKDQIKIVFFLPFKSSSIEFDSIDKTEKYLKRRTLTSIALDFYSGSIMAMEKIEDNGINLDVKVFDTQNKKDEIEKQINLLDQSNIDLIIGPMLPKNFNFLSSKMKLAEIPKVAPLSTNPVIMRKGVVQSITPKSYIRDQMKNYLNETIDKSDNILIISDSINRETEKKLSSIFPKATSLRPEIGDFLLPELLDSLIVDTLPNKIILETEKFSLISSASSQIRSQLSDEKEIRLYTTYHGSSYDDPNLSNKLFSDLDFTYMSDYYPREINDLEFLKSFINRFGIPPNKTSIRAYDLVYDLILRITTQGNLYLSSTIGETEYINNKFNYVSDVEGAYINKSYFLLKHQSYDIIEINK
tara:strand:+ start:1103 stop:2836 length:1734 start_codon:yes stop_codon:yes gene_type:complete